MFYLKTNVSATLQQPLSMLYRNYKMYRHYIPIKQSLQLWVQQLYSLHCYDVNEVVIHIWQGAPIPVKGKGLPVDVDSFPGQSWTVVRLRS